MNTELRIWATVFSLLFLTLILVWAGVALARAASGFPVQGEATFAIGVLTGVTAWPAGKLIIDACREYRG